MRIRPAILGDENVLAVLNGTVQRPHVDAHPEHFRPTQLRDVTDWFAALLRQPTAAAWIAEDDGVAVGYVLALFHEQPENPFHKARRWCEIDQLAVEAGYRRRGAARALVEAVVDDARANGIHDIELHIWSFNAEADAVFRRLGFTARIVRYRRQSGPDGSTEI